MSDEWNAAVYHQISAPQVNWGKKVLARIRMCGDETVLDAGCGTGRLTRDLLDALPHGRVVALDISGNMIDAARAYLKPDYGDRVEFVRCNLLEMPFDRCFHGIFSTASFHWVRDHETLFRVLYRALRSDGWLCAQCGGSGNLSRFLARVEALMRQKPFTRYFDGYSSPWEYSDAETAATRLERAGFEQVETNLEEAPTQFPNAQAFQQFVGSVILLRHLERLPGPELRGEFLAALTRQAASDTPAFLLDYWRLNFQARRRN